jgi:transcriptional regulator with XRE-family HTH domain
MAKKKNSIFNTEMFSKMLKKSGLKMNHVADKLGVSRITVSAWKTGAHVPSLVHMHELSRIFNVDIKVLMRK